MKVILNSNSGQIILILLLIMSVALAVGLSVVQRSLTDVSTSAKIDQSSRAFSAAEAGIEQALSGFGGVGGVTDLGNNASISNVDNKSIPSVGTAIEYPHIYKEEIAQVWLVNPTDLLSEYTGSTLDIFWGDPLIGDSDGPAIEITVTYESTAGKYLTKKYFFDSVGTRASDNRFTPTSTLCGSTELKVVSDQSPEPNGKLFYCKASIPLTGIIDLSKLILLRARLLYAQLPHPIAIAPVGAGISLPLQGKVFTSTGVSGESERKVQFFTLEKVVPFYFDYALFAADDIEKKD